MKQKKVMDIARLKEALNYNPDTGVFTWIARPSFRVRIGDVAGSVSHYGYIDIRLDGSLYKAHRLAWAYTHGCWPDQIDHINHKRDDNRIINLRSVAHIDNHHNTGMKKNNASGVTGVSWNKSRRKWAARIQVEGVSIYLGRFANFDDAVRARNDALIEYRFHENHGVKLSNDYLTQGGYL